MMSLAPVFASLGGTGKKINFENSQKNQGFNQMKNFLWNLAQCNIKIYSGPEKFFRGLWHFKIDKHVSPPSRPQLLFLHPFLP